MGRVLAGDGSTAAHNHGLLLDVRTSATVVARCTNVLTNEPSARSRVRSILPCGACSQRAQACDQPVANRSRKRQRPRIRLLQIRGLPAMGRQGPGACTLCPSGPCPARPRGRLASPPPFRAPWQCPTWRSHARGGCRQPRSRCPPAGTSPACLPCSSTF